MKQAYPLRTSQRTLLAAYCFCWLLLLLAKPVAHAQAPAWQLAIGTSHAGGPNTTNVAAMTTDASGNLYLTGIFGGTVSFGNITLTSVSLGPYDMFVAKWNTAAGRFDWVQQAGGAGYDIPSAIAVSGTSIYVGGIFSSSPVTFGSITVTGGSAFIAKLTDAGASASFTWVQQVGGAGTNGVSALAVNDTNIYAAGYFLSATATLGSTVLTNADASGNTADIFVARLADAGPSASFSWALRAGGTGADSPNALAVNGASLYMAGSFSSSSISFGNTTLANADAVNSTDIFVVKLSETGAGASFGWAQRAGGLGSDMGYAMALNGSNVYLAGSFAGAAAGFGNATLTNAGAGSDAFVAKLTDAGSTSSFSWAQRAGGTADDQARAIAVSGTDIYVAGSYGSTTASFGSSVLTNGGPGRDDLFVAKLADLGMSSSFSWAQRAGGAADDQARAVALSGTTVYVAGGAAPPSSFGSQLITNAGGGQTAFLAALPNVAVLATIASAALAEVAIAPNPAHGSAGVWVPGPTPAQLTLLDALGRVVRTGQTTPGASYNLDLQGLAPGLYALRVQVGAGWALRRLVVE